MFISQLFMFFGIGAFAKQDLCPSSNIHSLWTFAGVNHHGKAISFANQARAQTQAVVAMKVRNKNAINGGRGYIGKNKLPLRTLSRVKQQPLFIPAQQIGAMIPVAGGLLAGAAKDDQIAAGHAVYYT